ncbi:MAG: Y-family DNA polymerase [Flavobacterium sp.]|nr:MAG: Y-family DNA polymerase [Flavobacterium sp.]
MIALVDCNNFYASCERVFNHKVRNKPVVVLSNNDGCAIARSQEAKDLGIEMGTPYFEMKELIKQHDIHVFSSNYALYGDMSRRVNMILQAFTPNIEVYSIDESFLDLSGFVNKNLAEYGREIRQRILQCTDIPTCVGIAPTKSLAKIANKLAKRDKASGVRVLEREEDIENALRIIDIGDVWGVGRRYKKMLQSYGIKTAYDFTQQSGIWVKEKMSIVGYRLWQELQGKACLTLEMIQPPKKGICTSKSFANNISDFDILKEAVASHAARCAEKLRKQHSCAKMITIFLQTNPFRLDQRQYYPSKVINMPVASNSTTEIVKYAITALKLIYKPDYAYKKAGVIVTGIIPSNEIQQGIFDNVPRAKQKALMQSIDKINKRMGKDKVRTAAQGYKKEWDMRRDLLSPEYTTKLSDLLKVN